MKRWDRFSVEKFSPIFGLAFYGQFQYVSVKSCRSVHVRYEEYYSTNLAKCHILCSHVNSPTLIFFLFLCWLLSIYGDGGGDGVYLLLPIYCHWGVEV
jgi:hypothetical protein